MADDGNSDSCKKCGHMLCFGECHNCGACYAQKIQAEKKKKK